MEDHILDGVNGGTRDIVSHERTGTSEVHESPVWAADIHSCPSTKDIRKWHRDQKRKEIADAIIRLKAIIPPGGNVYILRHKRIDLFVIYDGDVRLKGVVADPGGPRIFKINFNVATALNMGGKSVGEGGSLTGNENEIIEKLGTGWGMGLNRSGYDDRDNQKGSVMRKKALMDNDIQRSLKALFKEHGSSTTNVHFLENP